MASFKKPTNMVAVNFSSPGVKYDTSTGKVERDSIDPSEHVYARTSHPMNLNLGQFVVNFTDMFDLTSSTKEIDYFNAIGIGRNYEPQLYGRDGGFFDVYVAIDDGSVGTEGDVLVYQNIFGSSGWVVETVDYYDDGIGPDPNSAFKALNEPMNLVTKPSGHTGTYNGVRFTFANEIITIEIGDAMTNTWEVLTTGHFIKPINYSNCALYPKVFIPDGKSCIITTKGRVEDY